MARQPTLSWFSPSKGQGFPGSSDGKESACQCRRHRFYPWVGKIPRGGSVNPLQYYCLENPMDRGAWQATVHRVAKNWTGLSKEIQPVHSKGHQPWDFFGRNDAKAETPVLWPPHAKS